MLWKVVVHDPHCATFRLFSYRLLLIDVACMDVGTMSLHILTLTCPAFDGSLYSNTCIRTLEFSLQVAFFSWKAGVYAGLCANFGLVFCGCEGRLKALPYSITPLLHYSNS